MNYTTNAAKLTNDTTAAWWVSGNFSPPATYTARLTETFILSNGSSVIISAKGLFNMYRPQATITATTGSVALDTNFVVGGVHLFGLHYGSVLSNATPGIVLSKSMTLPPGFSGSHQWIQIISTLRQYQTNDNSLVWYALQATNVIDGGYPHSDTDTDDSPGHSIDYLASEGRYAITNLSVSDSFRTWLEFQPTNGVWVPLAQVAWGWGGEAHLLGIGQSPTSWSGTNFTNTPNPPSAETQEYPNWTNVISNVRYYPK